LLAFEQSVTWSASPTCYGHQRRPSAESMDLINAVIDHKEVETALLMAS
jgi:hypothetical protein